jgi:uncharacterized HAD superfamily protein
MLPANLIALYLSKPFTDIHSFVNGHIYKSGERGQFIDVKSFRKILIVDDSIASGSAIMKSKELIKTVSDDFDISFCAIYVVPGKEQMVDYFFEAVPLPRYFQWNIFNHTTLEKACFDIDGVLCVDPTDEQNDDGPKYIDFILHASPLYIPKCQVGTLVTSRLEKYRHETETWLANNGVKYKKLVMLDLPNKEARQRAKSHGSHKAATYKEGEYNLFFESSLYQALEINKITGKPVFCTENFEMIFDSQSLAYNIKSGKYFPALRKLALKIRDKIRR